MQEKFSASWECAGKYSGGWESWNLELDSVDSGNGFLYFTQFSFSPKQFEAIQMWDFCLVLFHVISVTQNGFLNFNVLRNAITSQIRSICYGGCTEKLNESWTFNKYWSTRCARYCACSPWWTEFLRTEFLVFVLTRVIVLLMYKLPSQVLLLDTQMLKTKVLNCEKILIVLVVLYQVNYVLLALCLIQEVDYCFQIPQPSST